MAEVEVAENRTPSGSEDMSVTWWTAEDGGMRLDASEGGLWSGAFVPPPPRPLFLDEAVIPDGLTTCDLCSWAWQGQGHRPFHQPDAEESYKAPGELGWVLTLIIVSIISAAIGAVVMIIVLHCKSRMKKSANTDSSGVGQSSSDDKDTSATGVAVTENHYTHMACEALYAELERAAAGPAYQNSAYADGDASAPSSAYYSDLSGPERAYEEVGLSAWPPPPLPAIRESNHGPPNANTLSSDYV